MTRPKKFQFFCFFLDYIEALQGDQEFVLEKKPELATMPIPKTRRTLGNLKATKGKAKMAKDQAPLNHGAAKVAKARVSLAHHEEVRQ